MFFHHALAVFTGQLFNVSLYLVIWYHMYSFPSLKNLHLASAAYQPSTLLAIRGLVAQQEKPQINWPRAYQKCRTEHAVKTELLNSWCAAMTASVSRTLSPSCLSQDIVTPILSILAPPTIRPVSWHQFLMHLWFLTCRRKSVLVEVLIFLYCFSVACDRQTLFWYLCDLMMLGYISRLLPSC